MHFCSALYTQHLPRCQEPNRAFNNEQIMSGGTTRWLFTHGQLPSFAYSQVTSYFYPMTVHPQGLMVEEIHAEWGLWPGFLSRPFCRSEVPHFNSTAVPPSNTPPTRRDASQSPLESCSAPQSTVSDSFRLMPPWLLDAVVSLDLSCLCLPWAG